MEQKDPLHKKTWNGVSKFLFYIFNILIFNIIGEPSKKNGYELAKEITEAVVDAIQNGNTTGYDTPTGFIEARQAIVEKYTPKIFC